MRDDDEYLLQLTIKNNVLYSRIKSEFDTIKAFANHYHINLTLLTGLLNFKQPIYSKKTGKLLPSISNLLTTIKCELSDIIPENYEVKETNRYEKEVSEADLISITDQTSQQLMLSYTPEDNAIDDECTDVIEALLKTITPREAEVIRLRYFEGKTHREIGKLFGTSGTNIQICEKRALMKLSHPSRACALASYFFPKGTGDVSALIKDAFQARRRKYLTSCGRKVN